MWTLNYSTLDHFLSAKKTKTKNSITVFLSPLINNLLFLCLFIFTEDSQKLLVSGCFCVYSDVASFEYIRSSLEKTLLANLEKDDGLPFQVLDFLI